MPYTQLVSQLFSLRRANMRFPNGRRLAVVFFISPIFLLNLAINRLFLALDYIFFPQFTNQQILHTVFIVAAPRSGTTYLYHTLAEHPKYTCFKLWEMIFAPSICQKKIFTFLFKTDKNAGSYLKKTVLYIEDKLLFNFRKTHKIGLKFPEEDEVIMLWSFHSVYLSFFYPDSTLYDYLFCFEGKQNQILENRIMSQYVKYIQRHNYFYNKTNEKHFLSKNPALMGRIDALATRFPNAKILNINRCISRTLPSSVALSKTLCSFATSRPLSEAAQNKTINAIIMWYQLSEEALKRHFADSLLKINFMKLIQHDQQQIDQICQFLNIPTTVFGKEEHRTSHKNNQNYNTLNINELDKIWEILPFMRLYYEP